MSPANTPLAAKPPDPHAAYLGKSYFTELDGLRAVSALLVVTYHLYDGEVHYWRWLAGQRGVTIFFVLSGWLITTLALREESRRGCLNLTAFYFRRCCRILPLYYVTLALYALFIFALPVSPHLRAPFTEALPCFLLYFQEVQFGLWIAENAPKMVFIHAWTLGVEEKFYLLWPLLAFVLWRGNSRTRIRGTLLVAVLFALVPAGLAPLGLAASFIGQVLMGYSSLLAGCLLAFLLHDPAWFIRLQWLSRPAARWTVFLILLAAHFATPWLSAPGSNLLDVVYTLAVTGFMGCLLTADGVLQRFLRHPPLVFIGRLSYGVYLLHMLCISAVFKMLPVTSIGWSESILRCVLVCGLCVLAAWVLRRIIEAPCIDLGRRWSQKILRQADHQDPPSQLASHGAVFNTLVSKEVSA